jgi:tetratricopeptide (TPR) repeat protein
MVETLAVNLAQSGLDAEAVSFLKTISKDLNRARGLSRIAQALAHSKPEAAESLAVDVLESAQSLTGSDKDFALRSCIPAFHELQTPARLLELANACNDEQVSADASLEAARLLFSNNDPTAAINAIHSTLDDLDRINGAPGWKVLIIRDVLSLSREHLDQHLLRRSWESAYHIGRADWAEQSDALGVVANAFARAGDFDTALEIVGTIEDREAEPEPWAYFHENYRGDALTGVGEHMAHAGLVKDALSLESRADDSYSKAMLLTAVAAVLTARGEADQSKEILSQALSTIRSIGNDRRRCKAAGRIIPLLSRAADTAGLEEAISLATTVTDEYAKREYLGTVVDSLAAQADFKTAVAVASAIGKSSSRSISQICASAAACARAGHLPEALLLAEVNYSGWRIEAVTAIAQELRSAGRFTEFEEMVRRILDIANQAESHNVVCIAVSALVSLDRPEQALALWRKLLLGPADPKTFFEILEGGAPALRSIDGGRTLARICDAIVEIGQWW